MDDPVETLEDSRLASNRLLRILAQGHGTPRAITVFVVAAYKRSLEQARLRPWALAEATALHAALWLVARDRAWVLISWGATITHLGMLEKRRHLGLANALTLVRANLPAVAADSARIVALGALATDFLDGRIARGTDSRTRFGRSADFFADFVVWSWIAVATEPRRGARAVPFIAWGAPIVVSATASIVRGEMRDLPQPRKLRVVAATEVLLALRVIFRQDSSSASRSSFTATRRP